MKEFLIWSQSAVQDMKNIEDYIAQDSQKYAKIVRKEVLRAVKDLVKFPNKGRAVPEDKDEYFREILVRNYRVMYEIISDAILISAVFHVAMDITENRIKEL